MSIEQIENYFKDVTLTKKPGKAILVCKGSSNIKNRCVVCRTVPVKKAGQWCDDCGEG